MRSEKQDLFEQPHRRLLTPVREGGEAARAGPSSYFWLLPSCQQEKGGESRSRRVRMVVCVLSAGVLSSCTLALLLRLHKYATYTYTYTLIRLLIRLLKYATAYGCSSQAGRGGAKSTTPTARDDVLGLPQL